MFHFIHDPYPFANFSGWFANGCRFTSLDSPVNGCKLRCNISTKHRQFRGWSQHASEGKGALKLLAGKWRLFKSEYQVIIVVVTVLV